MARSTSALSIQVGRFMLSPTSSVRRFSELVQVTRQVTRLEVNRTTKPHTGHRLLPPRADSPPSHAQLSREQCLNLFPSTQARVQCLDPRGDKQLCLAAAGAPTNHPSSGQADTTTPQAIADANELRGVPWRRSQHPGPRHCHAARPERVSYFLFTSPSTCMTCCDHDHRHRHPHLRMLSRGGRAVAVQPARRWRSSSCERR